jgi:hypothetical protein
MRVHEHYCRLRSLLCPKGQALREAGMRAVKNQDAVSNATRLERRQDVRDRIAFLVRQEEEVLGEKPKRIEETLWAIPTRLISGTSSKLLKSRRLHVMRQNASDAIARHK